MPTPAAAGTPRPTSFRERCRRIASLGLVAGAVSVAESCAVLSSDPTVPASIEAKPLAFPSIAVGDSLRDTLGVAQPLQVLLRDLAGDIISDLPVRFLYVQNARDSALVVDSVTGYVWARSRPTGTPTQISARFGSAIQILIPVKVSKAPDSLSLISAQEILQFNPDTGATARDENSALIEVKLQYDSSGTLLNTADWLVSFTVVRPKNLSNDTTAAAFMIDELLPRPSQLDTSSSTGIASRRVRVRADSLFAPDTVEVAVRVFKRGALITGDSALRVSIPLLQRGAAASNAARITHRVGASARVSPDSVDATRTP